MAKLLVQLVIQIDCHWVIGSATKAQLVLQLN